MKNSKAGTPGKMGTRRVALNYMKTLIDVARESFIILDPDLRVISANPTFYQVFQVTPKTTENKYLFELGNGQWNIPQLKRLLEGVLPKKKWITNFEVTHVFEKIGEKTVSLNARRIDTMQLIILAIEDITARKILENRLEKHSKELEKQIKERTDDLSERIQQLELLNKTMVGRELKMMELKKEIADLKKKQK